MLRMRDVLLLSLFMALPISVSFGQAAATGGKETKGKTAPAQATEAKAAKKASAVVPVASNPTYDWKAERAKLKIQISAEVDKQVSSSISHDVVVKELGKLASQMEKELEPIVEVRRQRLYKQEIQSWKEQTDGSFEYPDMKPFLMARRTPIVWKYPMDEAKGTPEKVNEALKAELLKAYDKACPVKDAAGLMAKAKERYPLIRLDKKQGPKRVKLRLRVSRVGKKEIEGTLRQIEPGGVRIDNQLISRADMEEETAAMFFADVNATFIDKYVKEQQRKYSSYRSGFVAVWSPVLLPERLIAAGFVPKTYLFGSGKGINARYVPRLSDKPQEWISAKAFEKQYYERELARVRQQTLLSVQSKWFAEATVHGCREDYIYCKQIDDFVPCSKLYDVIQAAEK